MGSQAVFPAPLPLWRRMKKFFQQAYSCESACPRQSDTDAVQKSSAEIFSEIPVFGTLVHHIIVSRVNTSDFFIENMVFDPFHMDQNLLDAYYEADSQRRMSGKGCLCQQSFPLYEH